MEVNARAGNNVIVPTKGHRRVAASLDNLERGFVDAAEIAGDGKAEIGLQVMEHAVRFKNQARLRAMIVLDLPQGPGERVFVRGDQ